MTKLEWKIDLTEGTDDRETISISLDEINVAQKDEFEMYDRFGHYAIYKRIELGTYRVENGSVLKARKIK